MFRSGASLESILMDFGPLRPPVKEMSLPVDTSELSDDRRVRLS